MSFVRPTHHPHRMPPSVVATLRQYPSHPAATTIKQTVHGSPLRPNLSTEYIIIPPYCPRPRPSTTPTHNHRAPVVFRPLHHESETMAMQTPVQIRRHCMSVLSSRHGSSQIPVLQGSMSITGSSSSSRTPRHALPRKIASGVFFIDPTTRDCDTDASPSLRTLLDLSITHAVVARGCGSDLLLSSGMKALFVGPHDPLSRIVGWMRAVRSSLGACIIVSDIAAAAGYLVVELGLSPRSAWLRIARGVPPPGDLVLARLCALAMAQSAAKEGEDQQQQVSGPDRVSDEESKDEEARSQRKSQSGSDSGWRVAPRSCRTGRRGTRGESSLKHVLVSSL